MPLTALVSSLHVEQERCSRTVGPCCSFVFCSCCSLCSAHSSDCSGPWPERDPRHMEPPARGETRDPDLFGTLSLKQATKGSSSPKRRSQREFQRPTWEYVSPGPSCNCSRQACSGFNSAEAAAGTTPSPQFPVCHIDDRDEFPPLLRTWRSKTLPAQGCRSYKLF